MIHKGNKTGPTFICIGPEKTGTGWLYANLRQHPQVFLPPVKELLYFWEEVFLPDQSLIKRLTDSHWHHRNYRTYLKKRLRFYWANLFQLDREYASDLVWDLRYLFLPHNDNWYTSLFTVPCKVSGDVSPLYATLPEKEIERINMLFPDLKVIILLRNPIHRVWSKAKMVLCRHQRRRFEEVPEESFYEVFALEHQTHPSYVGLISTWKEYFPEENVHVNFYDKLVADPLGLLEEICVFLGLDPGEFPALVRDGVRKRVNVGLDIELPNRFAVHLAQLCRACIDEMCAYYEPYPQMWSEYCNNLLSDPGETIRDE